MTDTKTRAEPKLSVIHHLVVLLTTPRGNVYGWACHMQPSVWSPNRATSLFGEVTCIACKRESARP